MVYSMTGYGKGSVELPDGKLTVEIRSINGKNAEIGIRTSLIPKAHELEVRELLKERLTRGTIDLFMTWEASEESTKAINHEKAVEYYDELRCLSGECGVEFPEEYKLFEHILPTILHMPDVMQSRQGDIVNEDNWEQVYGAISQAVEALVEYRAAEGDALYADLEGNVNFILSKVDEEENFEAERVETVRSRILDRFEELNLEVDSQRLESEMIYYIEKFDINEEKVRLRQHCNFFLETLQQPLCGKKLGFIAQEMGREINTTGSKANHLEIQKIVVEMKDALEKIKEQVLNVL